MIPTWTPPWDAEAGGAVPAATAPNQVRRGRYSEGQFLGAVDFADEQQYHRTQLRRHQLAGHTWGIVTGLELLEVPDPADNQFVDVLLTPGLAVDGYGRQIVVFEPVRLGALLFDAFTDDSHRSVWLAYDEDDTRSPGSGFSDCRDGTATRTTEQFDIRIDPTPVLRTITVNGLDAVPAPAPPGKVTAPDDQSVPHQELPTDDPVVPWLVRLGSVRWDGTVQRLRPAAPKRLLELRRYAGVVADHVLTPSPSLRIAPRAVPADVDGDEFAVVEGRLRAKGRLTAEKELWLEGDPARFTHDGGAEANVPITLGRAVGGGVPGEQLRLQLGDDAGSATTALSIGAGTGPAGSTAMEVRADGTVSVPTGHLTFGDGAHRQQVDLHEPGHGIGTQPGVTYLRSPQEFAWFRGGSHVDAAREPGPQGQLQLRLDANGSLDFGARTRQMIDLWQNGNHNYGIGVQAGTLYFRTDYDVCWFRGGGHLDGWGDPGPGGALAMRLNSGSQLDVFGPLTTRGNVVVGRGMNGSIRVRHVDGKDFNSDAVDALFLNWDSGKPVVVGRPGNQPSDLEVSGALKVVGGAVDSVLKVMTYNLSCTNNGSTPGVWSQSFVGVFDGVPKAVAMLTGFSITSEVGSPSPSRFENVETIPQHAWVTVDSVTAAGANGRGFLAQSTASQDGNNHVTFTLLVIGRKWT